MAVNDELISRQEAKKLFDDIPVFICLTGGCVKEMLDGVPTRMTDVADKGEISDGYHTFNELYHHRAVLFSVVCHCHKFFAWKSKKHADGSMYDGMFIVGINTPNGPATYHYDIDPYWDMFDVKELENAPEWDGHTPTDAIERIASLVHRPPMWAV